MNILDKEEDRRESLTVRIPMWMLEFLHEQKIAQKKSMGKIIEALIVKAIREKV